MILSGCHHEDAPTSTDCPPAPVYLDEIGKTIARESVTIHPQMDGKIMAVHFQDGVNVKKGELLFSIDRFRPILMTTLAAVMGAVPIALGWGADGANRRPLGLVIVGGLLVSQLITLYVTPVIYLYMELFQEKFLDRTSFFRSAHAPAQLDAAGARMPQPVLAIDGDGNGNA